MRNVVSATTCLSVLACLVILEIHLAIVTSFRKVIKKNNILQVLIIIQTCSCYWHFTFFVAPVEPVNPCSPSPCGANAVCEDGICTCLSDYHGDPYFGCKPECVLNSDCSRDKACMNNKCEDPCVGTCGADAVCETINHIPMCSCPTGFTGSPFYYCTKVLG